MNFLRKHKVKILIISFILCLFLLYIFFKPFKEILSIIIISAIIAYILNPIKKYLINKKSLKEKKATLIRNNIIYNRYFSYFNSNYF